MGKNNPGSCEKTRRPVRRNGDLMVSSDERVCGEGRLDYIMS